MLHIQIQKLKSATAKKELGADKQETHIAIQFVLLVLSQRLVVETIAYKDIISTKGLHA